MRIALGIEYDGSQYNGWQSQPGLRTVQSELEEAIAMVATHPIDVVCAGRTDTGVHATQQVIHFDTEVYRSVRAWVFGTNSHLPQDISVRWAKPVADDFHARFSALTRRYRYLIYNQPIRAAIARNAVTCQYRHLDVKRMEAAAKYLVGEHDFTSYRALGCQAKTPTRTVHELSVTRRDDLLIIEICANAFLHHMVRNIAGVLMSIGAGTHEPEWAKEVLEARDRTVGGITAPAYGLYLVAVTYPEQYELPEAPRGPFFITGE
jgi:tRNA pseudouridine38-40 synthase